MYDPAALSHLAASASGDIAALALPDRARLLYTMAASVFGTIDIIKSRDQKTPATFFEILIGNLLSRTFGVNRRTEVEVVHFEDEASTLPTDFIFEISNRVRFHVPVKTSTRERAIQVFAHQRVLEGVYGFGSFKGLLVAFSETKTNTAS